MTPDVEALRPIAEQANGFAWTVCGLFAVIVAVWAVERIAARRKS